MCVLTYYFLPFDHDCRLLSSIQAHSNRDEYLRQLQQEHDREAKNTYAPTLVPPSNKGLAEFVERYTDSMPVMGRLHMHGEALKAFQKKREEDYYRDMHQPTTKVCHLCIDVIYYAFHSHPSLCLCSYSFFLSPHMYLSSPTSLKDKRLTWHVGMRCKRCEMLSVLNHSSDDVNGNKHLY